MNLNVSPRFAVFALNVFLHGVCSANEINFSRDVRPILSDRCFQCHGPDEHERKGKLRLDETAGPHGAYTTGALTPGSLAESNVWARLVTTDPDEVMPPPEAKKKPITEKERALIKQWIEEGAAYEGFWAFVPPKMPALSRAAEGMQAIDELVERPLARKGLTLKSTADQRTLLRRVTFDLTGLPPTREEMAAFLADTSPEAYEHLVDRLLANKRYGEHMTKYWLDLVRFAETWGHEQDFPIPEAWRYRDYVIRAFNADVPYDDFLVEHVAGDLVEKPRIDPNTRTNESIQGTGFWHLGEATHSPVDIREDECTRMANQIDVFTKAFLAQTVMCARCHDHKFEAITTKDYYRLFGYLQSSNFQLADIADPEAQAATAKTLTEIQQQEDRALRKALSRDYFLQRAEGEIDWTARLNEDADDPAHPLFALKQNDAAAVLKRWLDEETRSKEAVAKQTVIGTQRKGELDLTPVERPFDPNQDVLADYSNPEQGWYVSGHRFGEKPAPAGTVLASGIALEAAAHSDLLSERFTGLIRTKTFEITGDRLWFRYRGKAEVFLAVDSHRVCEGPLHSARLKKVLESEGSGYQWAYHDVSKYIGHRAHVEFTPKSHFSLSRVQFSHNEPESPFLANSHLKTLIEQSQVGNTDYNRVFDSAINAWDRGEADADQLRLVDWLLYQSGVTDPAASPRVVTVRKRFAKARAEAEAGIPSPIRALALMDGSAEAEPVHFRGNYRTLSPDPVARGPLLDALATGKEAVPPDGSGRLELAYQIVSPNNPLTARVFVNRVWHHLFRRGIVETVDNLGTAGSPPSHPELLDHLAHRFMHEQGWSTKRLLRELVLSQTYRMSSRPDPDKTAIDPENLLLHRMPIRRLNGETIRDQILQVSGRLDRQLYGPSVMVHISEFMRSNRSPAGSGPLDGHGRRSIYIEGRRNHMEPLLVAFDKPTPFTAIGKRNVSSSPAQPLMLLNNELVHQEAQRWAQQLLSEESVDEAARLESAYWQAFDRAPESWEKEAAIAFLAEQRQLHRESADAELQSWKDLAHTLFNVKEFIFIN